MITLRINGTQEDAALHAERFGLKPEFVRNVSRHDEFGDHPETEATVPMEDLSKVLTWYWDEKYGTMAYHTPVIGSLLLYTTPGAACGEGGCV